MTREEKNQVIDELTEVLTEKNVVYLTDTSGMTVEVTSEFRRICFDKNVQLRVVKNTLLKKAMENTGKDYEPLFDSLHGTTAVMTSETGNLPAKILKDFKKGAGRPVLKGAFIDTACFVGADQLDALVNLKSREELIGEIVGLLQSPARNVISALQSSGGTIAGLVKTLEERATN